jgi:bifunctional non-homologous end joining protein LigD
MMAVPFDEPFDDPAWGFEPKWDGVRAILEVADGRIRMWSRNGNEISAAYPELAGLASSVADGTVIDGEVVAFWDGRPSFERLQARMHLRDGQRVAQAAVDNPIVFMVFDILSDAGEDLTGQPVTERRARLEQVLPTSEQVQLSPMTVGSGRALFEAVRAQRLEGVVAKRLDSVYVPGRRHPSWRKIKVVHEVDAVIVGWRPGSGGRATSLGSLVVALFDGGELRSIGSVGSGFDQPSITAMEELLGLLALDEAPLDTEEIPDAGPVRWVRPELVAVVEYREVTSSGHLRAPVFKGMRSDKLPSACTIDQLVT